MQNSSALLQRRRTRDEVRDLLRGMIEAGALAPGSRLDETGLSARVGVSRTPLREALIALEEDGLVESEPNKGFKVVPRSAALVREIFPILAALEAAAVRLAGERVIALAPELAALNNALAIETRPAKQYAADCAFHDLLTRECGNPRLLKLIETFRSQSRLFDGAHARGTANHEGSCREHAAIVAALEAGQVEAAADLLTKHWRGGEDVVIAWIEEQK
jgi:DNA-binding GntR family transcriptional regulator